jgi:uncharacterized membrane protein HdeD (DUF308 family)
VGATGAPRGANEWTISFAEVLAIADATLVDGKPGEALALVGLLAGIQLVLGSLGLTGFGFVGTSRKTGEIVITWFKVA